MRPVVGGEFAQVEVRPEQNLNAKPSPASFAILDDVLVVVFHYGDGDHYFVGASQ